MTRDPLREALDLLERANHRLRDQLGNYAMSPVVKRQLQQSLTSCRTAQRFAKDARARQVREARDDDDGPWQRPGKPSDVV